MVKRLALGAYEQKLVDYYKNHYYYLGIFTIKVSMSNDAIGYQRNPEGLLKAITYIAK